MPSCSFTGLFPVNSAANIEGQRTTFILALCSEDDNVRNITLWINNLSGMQNRAVEDHACYISGTLLIYNEGPEAPFFVLEASSVEDLSIEAEKMMPSTERLAIAHIVGQIVPIANPDGREFGLSTGAWSSRDNEQRTFEVRLHFDNENPRFNNFRLHRIGANVDVEATWIRDTHDRSHWIVQHITYLGALPSTAPPTSPARKRFFGAGEAASASKCAANPEPSLESGKKKKCDYPAEPGSSTLLQAQNPSDEQIKDENKPDPASMTDSRVIGEEEDIKQPEDLKGKGKMKTQSHK